MKFGIKGFDRMSLVDWDGMVATTLYVSGCNFRCPYCHNSGLVLVPDQYETIPVREVLDYVKEHNDFLDGAVITGGEPCFRRELPELAELLQAAGVRVKVDTNGSFPDMLESLIKRELVDYVAMDIKAPWDKYSMVAGSLVNITHIKDSIDLVRKSGIPHEFRTTLAGSLLEPHDVLGIGRMIEGASLYVLQKFVPSKHVDKDYTKKKTLPDEVIKRLVTDLHALVSRCITR